MRISDWSSDVCSSDLVAVAGIESDHAAARAGQQNRAAARTNRQGPEGKYRLAVGFGDRQQAADVAVAMPFDPRSHDRDLAGTFAALPDQLPVAVQLGDRKSVV